jgi:hypothetical protein
MKPEATTDRASKPPDDFRNMWTVLILLCVALLAITAYNVSPTVLFALPLLAAGLFSARNIERLYISQRKRPDEITAWIMRHDGRYYTVLEEPIRPVARRAWSKLLRPDDDLSPVEDLKQNWKDAPLLTALTFISALCFFMALVGILRWYAAPTVLTIAILLFMRLVWAERQEEAYKLYSHIKLKGSRDLSLGRGDSEEYAYLDKLRQQIAEQEARVSLLTDIQDQLRRDKQVSLAERLEALKSDIEAHFQEQATTDRTRDRSGKRFGWASFIASNTVSLAIGLSTWAFPRH